jgi:hypothetical protein
MGWHSILGLPLEAGKSTKNTYKSKNTRGKKWTLKKTELSGISAEFSRSKFLIIEITSASNSVFPECQEVTSVKP